MTFRGPEVGHSLGQMLPLWSAAPFAGMLLTIALMPLAAPRFWHDHFGKLSFFWVLVLAVPFVAAYGMAAFRELLHVILADYIPFIILLAGLYAVSGGILLKGKLAGTPAVNTLMLLTGTALASWMGTTGAAMLMIRPLLRANAHREDRAFIPVFFIFLVANVGGALTPLGDPPLFLGFLKGVPFFWTFALLRHMALVSLILLAVFFLLDTYFHKRERAWEKAPGVNGSGRLGIAGWQNFLYLAGILGAVLLSGFADWGKVYIMGVGLGGQDIIRDLIIISMAALSLLTTKAEVREENGFTWFPLKEVAILFAAIFITMAPCLVMLQAGEAGRLAFVARAVRGPAHYFWTTGIFSSFLDNAPTYLTFLNAATGELYPHAGAAEGVRALIAARPLYLEAISAGAVFFGAFTYIGNAPNFMVRTISEEAGVRMPGFFGYIFKYSLPILLPVYILITVLFFL